MNKKTTEIFNLMKEKAKENLKRFGKLLPVCFIIDKGYKVSIIGLVIDRDCKEEAIDTIHREIANKKGVRGYIIIMDTKLTKMYKEGKGGKVFDALVYNYFSPKECFMEYDIYDKNFKVIENFSVKDGDYASVWNIWNKREYDESSQIEYDKFKREHPDKYKGVD